MAEKDVDLQLFNALATNLFFSKRSEVFAMRFDPKIKYMAELASRRQRRSLTNFVEVAIEEALKKVDLFEDANGRFTAANAAGMLWDVDEVERLRRLVSRCPDLLSYEEQRIYRVIIDYRTPGKRAVGFSIDESVNWSLVKSCWAVLQAYALGKGSDEELAKALRQNIDSSSKDSK